MSSSITKEEYQSFSQFLEKACGITLGENKQYLISSRLQKLMDSVDIASLGDLVKQLQRGDVKLRGKIVDAMTTNETLWFRDSHPYTILEKELLPAAAKQRNRPVRIWSAACSSGQEPYSMSMVAHEFMRANPGTLARDVEIVATDISKTILEQARQARYDEMSLVRGMSTERRQRYFTKHGDLWELNNDIKRRVRFTELNLMQSFVSLGKFDIIFCRNVLIYFSAELKSDILNRMAKQLHPEGYLILGSSESITGYSDAFKMVRSGGAVYYQLVS